MLEETDLSDIRGLLWFTGSNLILSSCFPSLTPTGRSRWPPLPEPGSAGGFFLLKGSFSFPLSPKCLLIGEFGVFDYILYGILTFMATVSLLVFLEECIYIYKKVPANKKSLIVWVNGAAPAIGTMSCLGMWFPRSTMFTDMFSGCYFAIVVFKFLILMVEEVGGDEAFLKRAGKYKLKISTGPCCCCCCCLPDVAITRRSLFLLKLGSFQFAVLKTAFTIFSIVLYTNGNYDIKKISADGDAIWINSFVGVLTITGLWPVGITFIHLKNTLRTIKIIPKYAMYQLLLILTQLQTAIINILGSNGTIACSPPFPSSIRGYMMSQQLLIMEMFIITMVTRLLYRRQYDPLPEENLHAQVTRPKINMDACDLQVLK
uniref:Solute carrier family 51 member A n=1 Tax=Oreochromis niloticus TaxID=8128 RepID=I3KAB5_ORENI